MIWQLQFLILFWIAIGLIVLTVLFGLAERFFGYGWLDGDGGFKITAICTGVFAGIAVIVLVLALIPFNSKYWAITHPAGTITSTTYQGGVVIDGDSGTVYVLHLDGKPTPYVLNDDKATSLKRGEHVTLACTVQWNYSAADTNNCLIAGK